MFKVRRSLMYILIRNSLILVLICVVGFSFFVNYVFNSKFEEQRLEVIEQDKLAEDNIDVLKNSAYVPIAYINIPSYLYNYIDYLVL